MFSSVRNNEFYKNVAKLLTGSVIAQAVPLLFAPVLTRIYSPEEFGVLGVYIALVTIIGVIVTGRYELAITQPKDDKDGKSLFFISIFVSLLVSLSSFAFILIFDDLIIGTFSEADLSLWLFLIPLSVLLLGVFQSLSYLNNRHKKYSNIAKSKVTQSFSALGGNLSLSSLSVKGGGLVIGYVVGQFLASIHLCYSAFKANLFKDNAISFSDLKRNAYKYKRFPFKHFSL